MDRAQEIQEAHIWMRHGDSIFGHCVCGTTRPITQSEHNAHLRSLESYEDLLDNHFEEMLFGA